MLRRSLLLLSIAVVACGDDASGPDDGGAMQDATDCMLAGVYALTPRNGAPASRVEFEADGSFTISRPGQSSEGSWSVEGGVLTLEDPPCPSSIGTYGVTFDTECDASIVVVADSCAMRRALLDGASFARQ